MKNVKTVTSKRIDKKPINDDLNERLDIHGYDKILERIWNQIKAELPEYVKLYQKYEDLLVTQSKSKAAKINNMRNLLSLGRILKKKGYDWNTITRDQVIDVQAYVMRTWADADGKETWHTSDHKKFLMLFVRWLKTGKREYDRRVPEPVEIIDITIKKVSSKITREDLLTNAEKTELLDACGDNLRDKALISIHEEAGDRAGETLNLRIGHVKFLENGGAVIKVNGKTGKRDIHLVKSVPDLAAWANNHPMKKNRFAPLWLDRYGSYLSYAGARAVFRRRVKIAIKNAQKIGKTSSLSQKRVFMTLFRHTEITNNVKWMSSQLSKKRHGWTSDSKMLSNYEHLLDDDVQDATFRHYGLQSEKTEDEEELPKICVSCKTHNSSTAIVCNFCSRPLTLKDALEIEEKKEYEKEMASDEAKRLEQILNNQSEMMKKFEEEREKQQKQIDELQKKLDSQA